MLKFNFPFSSEYIYFLQSSVGMNHHFQFQENILSLRQWLQIGYINNLTWPCLRLGFVIILQLFLSKMSLTILFNIVFNNVINNEWLKSCRD